MTNLTAGKDVVLIKIEFLHFKCFFFYTSKLICGILQKTCVLPQPRSNWMNTAAVSNMMQFHFLKL